MNLTLAQKKELKRILRKEFKEEAAKAEYLETPVITIQQFLEILDNVLGA